MSDTYDRRNARARAEGWTSYGQKRRALRLGHDTPSEYRQAKATAAATHTPVQAAPGLRSMRQLASGVVKAVNPEANREIGVKATRAGTLYGAKGDDQRQALATILRRTSGSRRVTFAIGAGRPLGQKGRGYSVQYIRDLLDEYDGDMGDVLDHLAAEGGYGDDAGSGYVSMGVV